MSAPVSNATVQSFPFSKTELDIYFDDLLKIFKLSFNENVSFQMELLKNSKFFCEGVLKLITGLKDSPSQHHAIRLFFPYMLADVRERMIAYLLESSKANENWQFMFLLAIENTGLEKEVARLFVQHFPFSDFPEKYSQYVKFFLNDPIASTNKGTCFIKVFKYAGEGAIKEALVPLLSKFSPSHQVHFLIRLEKHLGNHFAKSLGRRPTELSKFILSLIKSEYEPRKIIKALSRLIGVLELKELHNFCKKLPHQIRDKDPLFCKTIFFLIAATQNKDELDELFGDKTLKSGLRNHSWDTERAFQRELIAELGYEFSDMTKKAKDKRADYFLTEYTFGYKEANEEIFLSFESLKNQLLIQGSPVDDDADNPFSPLSAYQTALQSIPPFILALSFYSLQYKKATLQFLPYLSIEQLSHTLPLLPISLFRSLSNSPLLKSIPTTLKLVFKELVPGQKEALASSLLEEYRYFQDLLARTERNLSITLEQLAKLQKMDPDYKKEYEKAFACIRGVQAKRKFICDHPISQTIYSGILGSFPQVNNYSSAAYYLFNVKKDIDKNLLPTSSYGVLEKKFFSLEAPILEEISPFYLSYFNLPELEMLNIQNTDSLANVGIVSDEDFAILGLDKPYLQEHIKLKNALFNIIDEKYRNVEHEGKKLDTHFFELWNQITKKTLYPLNKADINFTVSLIMQYAKDDIYERLEAIQQEFQILPYSFLEDEKIDNTSKIIFLECLKEAKKRSFYHKLNDYLNQRNIKAFWAKMNKKQIFSLKELRNANIVTEKEDFYCLDNLAI